MGAVDLVVQVESPPSVASGLQRVGRAGHQVGAVSRGRDLPEVPRRPGADRGRRRADARRRRSRRCATRATRSTCSPSRSWRWSSLDDVGGRRAVRRWCAAPRRTPRCPRSAFESVLDMLAGRYPSDEFAELRPRLVWDRVGRHPDRPARRAAARGHQRRHDPRPRSVRRLPGRRQGSPGSASWTRRWSTSRGSATCSPSARRPGGSRTSPTTGCSSRPRPGQPGRLPFWKGDALGRPVELGRALGAFIRELGGLTPASGPGAGDAPPGSTTWAADNLLAYLDEQREATGHLPDDRTIVVERFRDELGDWRVAIHSPFGAQVHAPWALAIAARLRERYGVDVQAMHADDGIVLRLPDIELGRGRRRRATGAELAVARPGRVEPLVTAEVGGSALFASRFRECAARALLLPRRDPGRRTPLWQQRQRVRAAAVGGQRVRRRSRSCSRRCASACRTSSTCPGWSG